MKCIELMSIMRWWRRSRLRALTIILLPAVLFMYTIMVVDYSGIRDGLSKGFKLSVDNIGTSVGLVFFYVIAARAFQSNPFDVIHVSKASNPFTSIEFNLINIL